MRVGNFTFPLASRDPNDVPNSIRYLLTLGNEVLKFLRELGNAVNQTDDELDALRMNAYMMDGF